MRPPRCRPELNGLTIGTALATSTQSTWRGFANDAARGARKVGDRAFVSGTWCSDPAAEEAAEEFVIAVTTGENAGEFMLDAVTTEENGGPFVETSAATEYAYGSEPS